MKPDSAPGPDGIKAKHMQEFIKDQEFKQILRKAVDHAIREHTFDRKIVENIVQNRIREAVHLNPIQQGCRPGQGTHTCLNRFLHAAGVAASEHQAFGAIAFDFSKAYDRAAHYTIIRKLHRSNTPYYLISFVDEWLKNRTFVVRHRGKTSPEVTI